MWFKTYRMIVPRRTGQPSKRMIVLPVGRGNLVGGSLLVVCVSHGETLGFCPRTGRNER